MPLVGLSAVEDKALSSSKCNNEKGATRPIAGPIVRLILITALISITSVCFSAFARWNIAINGKVVHIALSSFLVGVYCGVYWYAWTRFRAARELRWALIAAAFAILFVIESAQIALAAGLWARYALVLQTKGVVLPTVSAGLLLAIAGRTDRLVRRPRIHLGLDQFINLICVTAAVYFLWVHSLGVAHTIWHYGLALNDSTDGLLNDLLNSLGLISVILVFTAAVISNAQKDSRKEEHQRWFLAYWCMLAGVSAVYLGISCNRYDTNWWVSTIISGIAGVFLLVSLNSENGQAYGEVQEKIGELQILHALSWKLVGTGTMETLTEAFALALAENLRADIVSVFLKDSDTTNALKLYAAAGLIHQDMQGVGKVYSLEPGNRRGFHDGHTSRAFQDLKVVVVEDIYADVEFLPWQVLAHNMGKVVSVPIVSSGEALGVYNLYITTNDTITPERIRLYETIAAAAGAAIQHVMIRQTTSCISEIKDAA